jgi:hypothetical protein
MCWHDGAGHGYPDEVLAAAGRLRDRHAGSGCTSAYTSITFSPSDQDLTDFVAVAPFVDLAYASGADGRELVEITGEGDCATVCLG